MPFLLAYTEFQKQGISCSGNHREQVRTQITVKVATTSPDFFPTLRTTPPGPTGSSSIDAHLKPFVRVLDEAYSVRFHVNGRRKSYTATSEAEAIAIAKRIESEQHRGLFFDYTVAHRTTFADLLISKGLPGKPVREMLIEAVQRCFGTVEAVPQSRSWSS